VAKTQRNQVAKSTGIRTYAAHPERFVKGLPIPAQVPAAVWINPPSKEVPLA
jgi:hypothetical protein